MGVNYQKVVSHSASWTALTGAADYQTIWPSNKDQVANQDDMFRFQNVAISVVNYGATTPTVTVEWSPDRVTYETWNSASFANLPANAADSMQISMNSRRYLRLTTSGSLSGSILTVVSANG
jgi:hypothetical protein